MRHHRSCTSTASLLTSFALLTLSMAAIFGAQLGHNQPSTNSIPPAAYSTAIAFDSFAR